MFLRGYFDGARNADSGLAACGWWLQTAETLNSNREPVWHNVAQGAVFLGPTSIVHAELFGAVQLVCAALCDARSRPPNKREPIQWRHANYLRQAAVAAALHAP